jgi:hypothetical protein
LVRDRRLGGRKGKNGPIGVSNQFGDDGGGGRFVINIIYGYFFVFCCDEEEFSFT